MGFLTIRTYYIGRSVKKLNWGAESLSAYKQIHMYKQTRSQIMGSSAFDHSKDMTILESTGFLPLDPVVVTFSFWITKFKHWLQSEGPEGKKELGLSQTAIPFTESFKILPTLFEMHQQRFIFFLFIKTHLDCGEWQHKS